jgi:FemAB-related protein (PEP-CTERM system-associated)
MLAETLEPTASVRESDHEVAVQVLHGVPSPAQREAWQAALGSCRHPAHDLRWLAALQQGLGHSTIVVEARLGDQVVGLLPLALVRSPFFGRFLVSLPYVNSAGPIVLPAAADAPRIESALVDRTVALADELNVRYLELRNEREISHPALTEQNTSKVHMRLALPATADALLASFKSKLRSQLKGALKHDFEVRWGGRNLLADFYAVFSRNMRDLGTPVYPCGFFAAILAEFGDDAELCVLRHGGQAAAAAAALLVHGRSVTEVPSASALRNMNFTGVNMAMYWHLLTRAIERGQATFDFGRSTEGSGTYKFKEQWGARPAPAVWQYHVRKGSARAMRPDNGKFGLAIRVWQKLPLWLANAAGPTIVRGIP